MKAKLTFDLPEDNLKHLCSVHGELLAFCIWEFLVNGHRRFKHHDPDNLYNGFVEAQSRLRELLEEEGVDIESLVI